jgi:hypothetical protein
MNFFHSCQLGNVNSYEDIVSKIKELKKYDKLIIVNDDENFTSAVIDLGDDNRLFSKKDFVFHLPKYQRVNETMADRSCTICQENLKCGEYYRELGKCKHIFHKRCVDEWFFKSKSYSCPLCRKNMCSKEL